MAKIIPATFGVDVDAVSGWLAGLGGRRSLPSTHQPGFRADRRTTRVDMICSILGNAF